MDEVVGQSRLLAAPGEGLRLAIAHMVNTQQHPSSTPPP